ncbi:MAG: cytochrome c [Nitrospirota bacterium]
MSILFLKSILSLYIVLAAFIAMFTMFEILGKGEKKYDISKLKRIHRTNGISYFLVYLFIAYFCLSFIITSKSELTPRGTFHSVFALTVIVLLGLKVSFVRIYRQFYGKVPTIGLLIALTTFGMMGTSGGYYFLVTKFGTDKTFDKIMEYKRRGPGLAIEKREMRVVIRTDPGSIGRGKNIFDSKCTFCHDPYSTKTIVGPGLKGVLKNPYLPVSGRPATPENIRQQLRQPFSKMPSFAYLKEEEVEDIIAFLNTL